jgi:hypothetical protein
LVLGGIVPLPFCALHFYSPFSPSPRYFSCFFLRMQTLRKYRSSLPVGKAVYENQHAPFSLAYTALPTRTKEAAGWAPPQWQREYKPDRTEVRTVQQSGVHGVRGVAESAHAHAHVHTHIYAHAHAHAHAHVHVHVLHMCMHVHCMCMCGASHGACKCGMRGDE